MRRIEGIKRVTKLVSSIGMRVVVTAAKQSVA
jgi:hypothetical protein